MKEKRKISFREDLGFVLVETYGRYKLNEELSTVEKALNIMKRHGCRKALFDHRKATVVISTLEAIGRAKEYEKLGFYRSVKIASLVNEICENLNFYELANNNRGWQVKVFTDYDAAIQWLAD